ncbi:hypothetical protein [Globicatella sp. PHS-GS-PNBC-21-1553]|nr:hypothetical protein [Globicatella sp. PHS-GS-PNBC-21-1553]
MNQLRVLGVRVIFEQVVLDTASERKKKNKRNLKRQLLN